MRRTLEGKAQQGSGIRPPEWHSWAAA